MSRLRIATITACTFFLFGCGTDPQQVYDYRNQTVKNELTLHRHPNGLCFAVLPVHGGYSIAHIPCTSGDTVFVPRDSVKIVIDTVFVHPDGTAVKP